MLAVARYHDHDKSELQINCRLTNEMNGNALFESMNIIKKTSTYIFTILNHFYQRHKSHTATTKRMHEDTLVLSLLHVLKWYY